MKETPTQTKAILARCKYVVTNVNYRGQRRQCKRKARTVDGYCTQHKNLGRPWEIDISIKDLT